MQGRTQNPSNSKKVRLQNPKKKRKEKKIQNPKSKIQSPRIIRHSNPNPDVSRKWSQSMHLGDARATDTASPPIWVLPYLAVNLKSKSHALEITHDDTHLSTLGCLSDEVEIL